MSAPAVRRNGEVLRNLPIDIDNEKNLIWCLFKKPDLLRDESISFSVDDFHFSPHCRIVQAMIDLDAEGIIPDPGMNANRLSDPSDREYLLNLRDEIWAHPSNAKAFLEVLRGLAKKRQSLFDADKLQKATLSGFPEDIARVRAEIGRRADDAQDPPPFLFPSRLSSRPHREMIVEGLIPRGIAIVLHSPPGTGKSVLLTEMTCSVASGRAFYGFRTVPGPVVYISGEWPDEEEIDRIWYEKTRNIPDDRLALVPGEPLWNWVSVNNEETRKSEWQMTQYGRVLTRRLHQICPELIVLDTLLGLVAGIEQLNNPQMYSLGQIVQKWATEFNAAVVIVAHNNQASSRDSLPRRLHYEALAGGNGLPGAVRVCIGMSPVRPEDIGVEALAQSGVALAVSKFTVKGFLPIWRVEDPGFFVWGRSGLELDPNLLSSLVSRKEKEEPVKFRTVLTEKGGDGETYY
ncbi:MAG: AAA family ATPase [Leptospirales bacterium]